MRRPPHWMRVTPYTIGGLVFASWRAGAHPTEWWRWTFVALFIVPVVWHVAATQR